MPNPKKPSRSDEAGSSENPEINNEDFQFVLKHLLATYQPILEEDLKRAKALEALKKEAAPGPQGSEDELTLARRIVDRFLTEEVAARLLPEEARKPLGSIEEWRWCLQNIRCCIIFGWLVCRGPRTFRAFVYYAYQYWVCIRESVGAPVATPPTEEQRKDFQVVVGALAKAYKPYLTDQLASVEFPDGIPDEVLTGRIDSEEGGEDVHGIFERFLTSNAAQALLGREAFSEHRRDPLFWFCRCWCLCAMSFGCCLARARSIDGLVECLAYHFRCLRRCAKPLGCDITGPTGCITGETDILPGRILEPLVGGAFGFSFGHYAVEVRDGLGLLLSGVMIYPDAGGNPDTGLTQGNFAVASGNLGWIDLKQCVIAAGIDIFTSSTFTVTLRVFATGGSELIPDCVTTFQLSLDNVFINQVSTPWSVNFVDPSEPLRVANSTASALATIGGGMNVRGVAEITGCTGETISEYTIWAIPDSTFTFPQPPPFTAVLPAASWIQLTHIAFGPRTVPQPSGPPVTFTADQVKADNPLDGTPTPSILTNIWSSRTLTSSVHIDSIDFLVSSNIPALDPSPADSTTFPKMAAVLEGGTGKFTFLLQVIDTAGNQFYDVQRAWIDNEPLHGAITGIGSLPPCSDLYTQTNAGVFKTVDIDGTAWDQLIDPTTPDFTKPTSDNFAEFTVVFQKQGAAGFATLIDSPNPVPARPLPVGVGTLTPWDLRTVDATLNPLGLPADQLLAVGQACTYNVILQVWDSTIVNEDTTHYTGYILFPIKIINGPEPI
jgi:hypothetical protein